MDMKNTSFYIQMLCSILNGKVALASPVFWNGASSSMQFGLTLFHLHMESTGRASGTLPILIRSSLEAKGGKRTGEHEFVIENVRS